LQDQKKTEKSMSVMLIGFIRKG